MVADSNAGNVRLQWTDRRSCKVGMIGMRSGMPLALLAIVVLPLLGGCKVGPDFEQPDATTAAN